MNRLALPLLIALSIGCSRDAPTEVSDVTTTEPSIQTGSAERYSEPEVGRILDPVTNRISGKVIRVADGDTLTILDGHNKQIKIRFNGIDAPEKAQAFGDKSRLALSNLVAGQEVEVVDHGLDKYDRTIGDVYHNGDLVNLWMVRNGWAWHYKKYSDDDRLAQAEIDARSEQLGLWCDPAPLPPWQWRHPPFDPNDERLYRTGNGKRFHRASCPTLDGRKRVIDADEIVRQGLTPCRACKPTALE